MTIRKASQMKNADPIRTWDSALRPILKKSPQFPNEFFAQLRTAKLTFGKRVHCPFLRPFFLSPEEEHRIRHVSETIAALAERVTSAALSDGALFSQFCLRPEEERLARMATGYGPASTASRLDAFLLPNVIQCTEYNGESPAGAGYSETLAEIFQATPVMEKFAAAYETHSYPLSAKLLDALVQSYLDWGGKSHRPQIAIVDWKEVPTWREFEILKERFERMGVPTVVADPRELEFDGRRLAAKGKKIDLVYRRVLINDIVARASECEALTKAYSRGSVCVANNFRCKIPHVKAFFAVLTDERNARLFSNEERALIRKHVPWTRVVREGRTAHHGKQIDLLKFIRSHRASLVLKPSDEYGGMGVTLGWETSPARWDKCLEQALPGGKLAIAHGAWIVQERIAMRKEVFPHVKNGKVEFNKVLVDIAPYLFRGRMAGFLTRLSATGLANVTSGGGQVPSFRVEPRKEEKRKVAAAAR